MVDREPSSNAVTPEETAVEQRRCAACCANLSKDAFSGKQWTAKAAKRRCKECVASDAVCVTAGPAKAAGPAKDAGATNDAADPVERGKTFCDAGCGELGVFVCNRCCNAWYCGVSCQRKHWKAGHKILCVPHPKPSSVSATGAAAQQKWIKERLNPVVNDPRTRELIGRFMFDRRMDEGSIADKPGRVEKGFNLERQLVVFCDLDEFRVRGLTSQKASVLWFADLPGLRFAAKEARRRTKDGAFAGLPAGQSTVMAATYNKVKECYDRMDKVAGRYMEFIVVFTDSNTSYSDGFGGRPDATCKLTWPESCMDEWIQEMQAAGLTEA